MKNKTHFNPTHKKGFTLVELAISFIVETKKSKIFIPSVEKQKK